MNSKVDRELARIEERKAEEAGAPARKGGVRSFVKRVARDLALRRVSTKR